MTKRYIPVGSRETASISIHVLNGVPFSPPSAIAMTKSKETAEVARALLKGKGIPVQVVKAGRYWFIKSMKPKTAQLALRESGLPIKTNPLLETIGAAAITGAGLGVGFKAVDWAAKRFGRHNPVRMSEEAKFLRDLVNESDMKALRAVLGTEKVTAILDDIARRRNLRRTMLVYSALIELTAHKLPARTVYGEKNPVTIDGRDFPIVDIGQLSPEIRKELSSLVGRGKVIKYTDYTFPKTKTGYILASHKISPEKQAKRESLRSLREGIWIWHPRFRQIERKMMEELRV